MIGADVLAVDYRIRDVVRLIIRLVMFRAVSVDLWEVVVRIDVNERLIGLSKFQCLLRSKMMSPHIPRHPHR